MVTTPPRMIPLLDQFAFTCERLTHRLVGPEMDSGDGENIAVSALTDDEYLWEPVPNSWTIRRREAGPGPGATVLAGAGEWGRDGGRPHP